MTKKFEVGIHYGSPANWKLNSPRVIRLISQ